ncbi:MAG: hypothetical protein JWN48_4167 [Myxococcaceae bacterium]|nr:hypothetical protein [Myxococcaceae bacterium]
MPRREHGSRWIARGALLLLCSGFVWPGRGERLVKELTSASTPRDKRDALRLLASLLARGDWQAGAENAVLQQLASDADPDVRIDALRLLAALPALERTGDPWLRALDDRAPTVRAAAVAALQGRGKAGPQTQLAEPELLEGLLRASSDTDARVRQAALQALAALDDPRALDALIHALQDAAIEVRVAGAEGLGQRASQGSGAAQSALLSQVDAGLPELRAAVITALGQCTGPLADSALALALEDADSPVVLAALRGLARANERPLPPRVHTLAASASSPVVAALAERLLERRAETAAALATQTQRGDPAWLAPLEQTALRGASLADSSAALVELERTLPRGEVLATEPLREWLGHAPPSLRARIEALIARTRQLAVTDAP